MAVETKTCLFKGRKNINKCHKVSQNAEDQRTTYNIYEGIPKKEHCDTACDTACDPDCDPDCDPHPLDG